MPASFQGRRPTIPEYYRDMINSNVNLANEPKQCCPFHKEDTPSFSYSAEKGVWRCFGGCKAGGDVVELHRYNYQIKSRAEAEKSLNRLYGVTAKLEEKDLSVVDEEKVSDNVTYQKAILLANTPERWIELDYVMSKYPVDYTELRMLVRRWSR